MIHLETISEDELTVGTYKFTNGFPTMWDGNKWKRMVALDDLIRMCREDTTRWFPQVKDDLAHMVLALNEEAGEVAGALKKGQQGTLDYDKALGKIANESVDVLIYLCNIWGILSIDPAEVFNEIRRKNEKRFAPKGV